MCRVGYPQQLEVSTLVRRYVTLLVLDKILMLWRRTINISRVPGADTVSGLAWPVGIHKFLPTVTVCMERDRIDHANVECEIEAADRSKEAEIPAA
jgi:hypothetical protein